MKRLFYNCEKIRLSYNNDVDVVYDDSKYPDDDNGYLIIRNVERDPGLLLHIYMYDEDTGEDVDKGLFIVDDEKHLISITCGEQFYKPLYEAYDDLIDDINKI